MRLRSRQSLLNVGESPSSAHTPIREGGRKKKDVKSASSDDDSSRVRASSGEPLPEPPADHGVPSAGTSPAGREKPESDSSMSSDSEIDDSDLDDMEVDDDADLKTLASQACGSMKESLSKSSSADSSPPLFVIDKTPTPLSVTGSERTDILLVSDSENESDTKEESSHISDKKNSKSGKKRHKRRGKNKHPKDRTTKQDEFGLASSLQVDIDTSDVYVNVDAFKKPADQKKLDKSVMNTEKEKQLLDKSVVSKDFEKNHTVPAYEESVRQQKKRAKAERSMTKGERWFDMRAPEMTEEKKNDLMVIQMRRVLNPKAFYKGPDIRGALPKFFQMGRVVDNPVDFYHNRIPKKQRKATLVEELLADSQLRQHNKKKYAEIVESRQRHSRGAFKHMKRLKKKKK